MIGVGGIVEMTRITIFALLALLPVSRGILEGTGKTLIAHRGASAYAPEHTLEAYRLAIEQGADYVEPDLQVTRDGVLVCLHDLTLQRTTDVERKFPDRFREVEVGGETVRGWFVADFTLEELKTLDAGSWFDDSFRGARVLSFGEAIELVKGRAGLYPELKFPEFYRGRGHPVEELLMEELRARGLDPVDPETPVIVQSFDLSSLRILRNELRCALPLVFLISLRDAELWASDEGLREVRATADGIGPHKDILLHRPDLVGRAHALGLTVTPYTFRSSSVPERFETVADEMRHFLFDLGVDALFTDNPDLFPRD
jgi:glycerophosphoryl diester phosphodiesterase